MKIVTNKYRLDIVSTSAQEKMVDDVIAKILFGEASETSFVPEVSPALAEAVRKSEAKPAPVGGTESNSFLPGYHGLLLVRCAKCGKTVVINAREPMPELVCRECGETTPLEDLAVIDVACDCGTTWHYYTNLTAATINVWCKSCGRKTAVSWDKELRKYTN